jgi:hypothetical protein
LDQGSIHFAQARIHSLDPVIVTAQALHASPSVWTVDPNGSTPPGYVNGNPLFFTLPGRSFQVNLSASC